MSFLQILAPEIQDRILTDFMDVEGNLLVTMHIRGINQNEAIKMVKRKITDLDAMKIQEQKKAARSGYDLDILPSDLSTYGGAAKNLLQDLQSRNERMFNMTFLMLHLAPTKQKLEIAVSQSASIAQTHNCILTRLDFQQEDGLMSSLPLGLNRIKIERSLTTSALAVFIPFVTQELFMGGDAMYYGLNALSGNMILLDRKQSRCPNGLVFGTPGSGKSMSCKREITYAYLDIMDRWLKEHGMPEITRVYKITRDGRRLTLEDECLKSGTLPSIAYGFKRCSLKHKIGPQEKFCNNYPPCRKVWVSGKKVVKFIGYDAGEHYRSDKVLLRDLADPKYSKWYPLMEWGWDREACIRAIKAAGLPQPGKSSCFFCPSMRAEEIIDLREHYPDLFRRALALEDNARANLKTVQGLGRNYSWRERFGKEFI